MAKGATSDERANSLENVTKTIGNLLDGYDIRLRPNFGGENEFIKVQSNLTFQLGGAKDYYCKVGYQ